MKCIGYWIAKNVLLYQNWQTKMHSQTVWMLFFYLFCCFTYLLGYLLIGLNVWHTNHPSCGRFFSIPRQSGMYVSQWKKQSKGNHMNKNTLLILCSTSGRISRKIFAMNYHFIPLKMEKRFSKKTRESPLDAPPTSQAWYYHEKPQLHRKFESHGSQRQKKTEMGDFHELIYLEPWNIHAFKMADWMIILIFTMERWLEIIKPP